MNLSKKLLAALLACFMMITATAVFPSAADEDFVFIEGENITRGLNMAVIYRNIKSTNQNQWGYNIVIDNQNKVTDIIKAGDTAGANLAVPEGGAVISASGAKVEWFEDNIDTGDIVYYDNYTKKLFVCNSKGKFDPYFTKTYEIKGSDNRFVMVNPDINADPQYSYDIAVDENGTVIARGGGVSAPEDGFTVSAPSATERAFLIMFAPIGAKCEIDDNTMTLTLDDDMLEDALNIALDNAKEKLDTAKTEFDDIDFKTINEIINHAEDNIEDADYQTYSKLLYSLENEITALSSENSVAEMRGAFYTPTETSETEVRTTVRSAKEAGLNTIILRVSNGYGTFIPLPEDFKFQQDKKFGGFDVLKSFINICKDENIGLSLCIETYYNEYASVASAEWLSKPNGDDESFAKKYFSPASQEFKLYFLNYVDYIISNYDIKHIMFDYLRYPKFIATADLGYDYTTMQLFSTAYDVPITEVEAIKTELFDSEHWNKWVEFKTGLVNDMAKSIFDKVREKRSDITLTAVAERDTVNYFYMQNARYWIENGWFEGLCLAFYESDTDENDPLPENGYYDGLIFDKGEVFTATTAKKAFFFAGLESNAQLSADEIMLAIEDSRKLSSDGFVFSDLDGFLSRNYADALSYTSLRGESVSPFIDEQTAIKIVLDYSKNKLSNLVLELDGCDEDTLTDAYSLIDNTIEKLKTENLSHEDAKKLESDIAILFASSPAKSKILAEFEKITKMALLAKEKIEKEPESDVSANDTTSDISEESAESSLAESETAAPSVSDVSEPTSQNKISIDVGTILIYGFVSLTMISVIVAMVVGLRRKSTKPTNHHMPKGSAEGYENKENQE